ncbi:hypothetical protein DFH09DRAFT_1309936 [Mycena vulgaris]|nr:hypothetical protein DFH09DRAFT_1309936 [Mycena vulgaris]
MTMTRNTTTIREPPSFIIYAMDTAPGELGPPPVKKLTAGIKLFVSALGSRVTPLNPNDTATSMAKWVKDYGVDGVDVDSEDYQVMWIAALRRIMGRLFHHTCTNRWLASYTVLTLYRRHLYGSRLPDSPSPRDELPNGGYRTIDQAVGHIINWVFSSLFLLSQAD